MIFFVFAVALLNKRAARVKMVDSTLTNASGFYYFNSWESFLVVNTTYTLAMRLDQSVLSAYQVRAGVVAFVRAINDVCVSRPTRSSAATAHATRAGTNERRHAIVADARTSEHSVLDAPASVVVRDNGVTTGLWSSQRRDYDYGFVRRLTIGDRVWLDTNGNGIQVRRVGAPALCFV